MSPLRRLSDERGLTLLELLITLVIVGILLSVAVPSYLGFRIRASDSAAQQNVRKILPAINAYYQDNSSYTGMTLANLKSTYDQAIDTTVYSFGTVAPAANSFCVHSAVNGRQWSKAGPAAAIAFSFCP